MKGTSMLSSVAKDMWETTNSRSGIAHSFAEPESISDQSLLTDPSRPVPTLIVLLPRATFTGTIFMTFGRQSIRPSETGPGQEKESVPTAKNGGIARGMVFITG